MFVKKEKKSTACDDNFFSTLVTCTNNFFRSSRVYFILVILRS
jgi:hypothetical protein